MRRYDAILFDLDGTITDSKIGIINSIVYSLNKCGIIEENLSKLETFLGPPLHESFTGTYSMSDDEAETAIKYYREYFSVKGMYENAVYAGIKELLGELKGDGRQIILATSKPTDFAQTILKHFELDRFFNAIIGSNFDGTRSLKAEVIEAALKEVKDVPKAHTIMVGDRKHDLIGARDTGIDSIGVLYGYGPLEELQQYSPTFLVKSVSELRDLLMKSHE